MNASKKRVIGLVGPTASGKTALSLEVAQRLGGEILCMDSMQIYRRMDIGTAKPTPAEQALVPHHLLDLIEPTDTFSVTQYADRARNVIDQVSVPILVGGTGLYLQALSLPMDFGTVPGDEALRSQYHALAREKGNEAVHALLQARDPVSAARLHPNDLRRVIRALEVVVLTGKPLSAQQMPGPEDSPYDFRLYAIAWPRDVLYDRVNRRVIQMIRDGLTEEVKGLLHSGVSPDAQSMQGLGYKELVPVIAGKMPLPEAAAQIQLRTRHFAKRQLTWFQRDERIHWIDASHGLSIADAADMICKNDLSEEET